MTRLLSRSWCSSLSSLVAVAALGCGETEETKVDQLNLDRPTDVAFGCYGNLRITNGAEAAVDQEIVTSAMPAFGCEARSKAPVPVADRCQPTDPKEPRSTDPATPPGQETLRDEACKIASSVPNVSWYGFVLQPGPGTVAVVSLPAKASLADIDLKVEDVDKLTPGRNAISVGEDPVAIVTDRAGCHAITANAGSCDLSVLDINSALDGVGIDTPLAEPAIKVDRLAVKNASGVPIRAKPAAMVAEPSLVAVGNVCPATPTGLVYIAYPSCHLVAGVDAATGTIVTGVQYDAAGVPSIVGGDVTCPDECGGDLPTAGIRPVTLDLELDPRVATRRLVIGASNSRSIAVVELDDATRPLSLFQVALEDPRGDLGVSTLALSPQIGMGGSSGSVLDESSTGGQFQFVYAVATDNTVRVADVLDVRSECDTQVDPRFARGVSVVRRLSCFPVGDPATPPRRAAAVGPGISLPRGEIPFSVDFLRSEVVSPTRLIGYFAMISSSSGATYVANVDDDDYGDVFKDTMPLAVSMPLAMAHQLRDGIGARGATADTIENDSKDGMTGEIKRPIDCDFAGDSTGGAPLNGPRAVATPERSVPPGSVATEKLTQLPGFRQLLCNRHETMKAVSELSFVAPDAVRDEVFPDLAALSPDETWAFTWEGSLSNNRGNDDVGGPGIRESMLFVDTSGMHLRDQEKPFCDAGVEPFDIVQLRGCDPAAGNGDCPSGYTCFVHPESQVQGLGSCMRADEADRLANACKDFLTTIRRYTVKTAETGELLLMPRRFELRTTPLDGCTDDAQCKTLADYAARSGRASHPIDDNTAPDPHTWSCVADPNRAPMGGTGKRCEMRCNASSHCSTGTICVGGTDDPNNNLPRTGFCMEGVTPPQACVNAPQRFSLHAGEAFAVLGTRSGFVHPIIANAAGQCVKDPLASPLLVGRLPLEPKDRFAPNTLHACDPSGMFAPNPCSITLAHTDAKPKYDPGTCNLARDGEGHPITELVERQAPAVRFRNRGLTVTIVDPYYPGDATCITDQQGNLGKIPHVVPGYVLSFRQIAGFTPVTLVSPAPVTRATFPVKVVRGPVNTTWVMDQGDFLSTTSGIPSTRGAVFVYNALSAINILR